MARRVRRVGGGVREPVRRPPQPRGLPQLGLRSSHAGARGRRRRRRGAVPEHRPAVLPDRVARDAPADHPRRLRPPLRRASRRTTGGSPTSAPRRPGRRAGIAQIFLYDVDDAVQEIERAREAEPLRRDPAPGRRARLRACHLSMRPSTSRSGRSAKTSTCRSTTTPARRRPTSGATRRHPAVFIIELSWYSHRVFWHMLFGNVFSRHPRLRLALTEQSSGWVPPVLAMLDSQYNRFQVPGTSEFRIARRGGGGDGRAAERDVGAQLLPRVELPAPERVRAALRDRRRQDHVGPGLPARRGHVPVHDRSAAQHVRRRSRPTRSRPCSAATPRASTASTSTRSRRSPRASARPSTRSPTPLDEIPADAYSVAFTGEAPKPW